MKDFNFLVCYDIADPKRLAKIAKLLENNGIRIQKSIFFCPSFSKKNLKELSFKIEEIIDNDADDVRIYQIDIHHSIHLNSAVDLKNPNIIGDFVNEYL